MEPFTILSGDSSVWEGEVTIHPDGRIETVVTRVVVEPADTGVAEGAEAVLIEDAKDA